MSGHGSTRQLDELQAAIEAYRKAGSRLADAARAIWFCSLTASAAADQLVAATGGAIYFLDAAQGEAASYVDRLRSGDEVIAGRSRPAPPPAAPPRPYDQSSGIPYKGPAGLLAIGGMTGRESAPPVIELS